MNQAQRIQYAKINEKQLKRLEGRFVRKIYDGLRDQVLGFVEQMENSGIASANRNLHTTVLNDQVLPVIRNIYVEGGLFFARKTYREIRKLAKSPTEKAGFGFNEEWINAILEFFRIELFQTVSRITETTRQQLLDVLSKATQQGWGIEKIAQQLRSPSLVLWRARLIARTELAKAAFEGRKLGTLQSEWETTKEWVSAHDSRTRHSHRHVDGDVIDYDEFFKVPRQEGGFDKMKGPGDPSASLENIVNCRCTVLVRPKRDARGRLIKRERQLIEADLSAVTI